MSVSVSVTEQPIGRLEPIERLVLLGATGDLAGRFLLPAVARLLAAGELPAGLQVGCAAREQWDDERFRGYADDRLREHAGDRPAADRHFLVQRLRYRPVDLSDPASVGRAVDMAGSAGGAIGTGGAVGTGGAGGPVAVYLALPPATAPAAVRSLGAVGLPPGSRIVVEKPFGQDLDSAVALNALLAQAVGAGGEQAVFRVDHVLAMPALQDLLDRRTAEPALERAWNSTHIAQVDLLWEETLALEGRADFYDRAGALKDVVQNHLLQVLSVVAMDLPTAPGERELRDRKVEVLRSVRAPAAADPGSRTRRARYTAGRLAGATGPAADRPDYAQEDGVDPARGTETYAELVLGLDLPRWSGTRFVLRAGKALAQRRRGVLLHLRPGARLPAAAGGTELPAAAGGTELPAAAGGGQLPGGLRWFEMDDPAAQPATQELLAYGRVLSDVLSGGSALSVRADEAEQAWRVVDPVLRAWAAGAVPLLDYPAGSSGPGGGRGGA